MKEIITNPEAVAIYMENFNQLGEAILLSGGNSFSILKRHDELLRILAINNIRVTAKHNYPEDDLQKLVKEDPMGQKPLNTNNPNWQKNYPYPNTTSL